MATTFSASCSTTSNCNLHYPKTFSIHSSNSYQFIKNPLQIFTKGLKLPSNNQRIKAVNAERILKTTSWDEKPYEVLPNGKKSYLDEQDVVTFLDPPKDLIPLDPSTYNPASYLWKKISEIPEERRHRLLYLFNPRLISAAWEAAGTRYDDAKLAEMSSSSLLSAKNDALSLEFWNCRKSGGPIPLALISHLQKALFRANGKIYGRLIGGSTLARIATSFSPLYFSVKEVHEVMPTEQPCDIAYEFGDGHLDLQDYPEGFPKPGRHPRPFNDQVVIYVRHVGPGVMVGQAWQEGIALEQVPKKLCGEILMVKDYSTSSADSR
ncbi:uncharacterized protein LOC141613241 [Silene latifolia]|uniref:uncharacterized protein LOC141613241 n=1 Tax=Silene latifolia TaxID=37657 RepID=UPI003D78AF3A